MGKTSWQVKERYNQQNYRKIQVSIEKDLVSCWEEKLKEQGISKAEFFRTAIKEYLGKAGE